MENELGELFLKVADCIEKLAESVKHTSECVTLLTHEIITLRDDVNKLIENNQTGAPK
jgi:FtsZ-binding cell division protein ZapB